MGNRQSRSISFIPGAATPGISFRGLSGQHPGRFGGTATDTTQQCVSVKFMMCFGHISYSMKNLFSAEERQDGQASTVVLAALYPSTGLQVTCMTVARSMFSMLVLYPTGYVHVS